MIALKTKKIRVKLKLKFPVAFTEPRRTEYLLRKSTTRAPIAHGIVSGVECARQLWLRFEEKETQKRSIARGFGRYNSLLCAFYSFFNYYKPKENQQQKKIPCFPSQQAFFQSFEDFYFVIFVYLLFSLSYGLNFLRKIMKKKINFWMQEKRRACGKKIFLHPKVN